MAVNEKSHRTDAEEEKPLRLLEPGCYGLLVKELETFHLHPYDVKASAVKAPAGLEIIIRYGEELTQTMNQFFAYEAIRSANPEISVFFKKAGEACKQALIADYFKMIKP